MFAYESVCQGSFHCSGFLCLTLKYYSDYSLLPCKMLLTHYDLKYKTSMLTCWLEHIIWEACFWTQSFSNAIGINNVTSFIKKCSC